MSLARLNLGRLVAEVHDRMPVILEREQFDTWMRTNDVREASGDAEACRHRRARAASPGSPRGRAGQQVPPRSHDLQAWPFNCSQLEACSQIPERRETLRINGISARRERL